MLTTPIRRPAAEPLRAGIQLAVAWCFAVASLLAAPLSAADGNDIEIRVQTDSMSYATGAPVELTVLKCNSTDEVITVTQGCPCCHFNLEILDSEDAVIAYETVGCIQVVVDVVWQPGECLEETATWQQRSGPFDLDGSSQGSQVAAGTYRARYTWTPGTVNTVSSSDPFTIEADENPCPANELCLGDDQRFRVSVDWATDTGNGQGVARDNPTRDTGSFWFFNPDNVELVVKVLDGRPINGHFWVFYGSLTDVAFDLEVVDTVTGNHVIYQNPAGTQASRGDITALPSD